MRNRFEEVQASDRSWHVVSASLRRGGACVARTAGVFLSFCRKMGVWGHYWGERAVFGEPHGSRPAWTGIS